MLSNSVRSALLSEQMDVITVVAIIISMDPSFINDILDVFKNEEEFIKLFKIEKIGESTNVILSAALNNIVTRIPDEAGYERVYEMMNIERPQDDKKSKTKGKKGQGETYKREHNKKGSHLYKSDSDSSSDEIEKRNKKIDRHNNNHSHDKERLKMSKDGWDDKKPQDNESKYKKNVGSKTVIIRSEEGVSVGKRFDSDRKTNKPGDEEKKRRERRKLESDEHVSASLIDGTSKNNKNERDKTRRKEVSRSPNRETNQTYRKTIKRDEFFGSDPSSSDVESRSRSQDISKSSSGTTTPISSAEDSDSHSDGSKRLYLSNKYFDSKKKDNSQFDGVKKGNEREKIPRKGMDYSSSDDSSKSDSFLDIESKGTFNYNKGKYYSSDTEKFNEFRPRNVPKGKDIVQLGAPEKPLKIWDYSIYSPNILFFIDSNPESLENRNLRKSIEERNKYIYEKTKIMYKQIQLVMLSNSEKFMDFCFNNIDALNTYKDHQEKIRILSNSNRIADIAGRKVTRPEEAGKNVIDYVRLDLAFTKVEILVYYYKNKIAEKLNDPKNHIRSTTDDFIAVKFVLFKKDFWKELF